MCNNTTHWYHSGTPSCLLIQRLRVRFSLTRYNLSFAGGTYIVLFCCQNFIFAKFSFQNLLLKTCGFLVGNRSLDLHDVRWSTLPPDNMVLHSFCFQRKIWVTYINNVLSNKTILFDILDFWCQLVLIRFVKTLSKRRMFVSSMKFSACWLLHRWIIFNKICWEKRPAKTRPNLRTSFCRCDLKNTQPHLKYIVVLEKHLYNTPHAIPPP